MFWNPAIIGALPGTQIETNLTLMGGWLVYDRKGIDPNTGEPYEASTGTGLAPNLFFATSTPLGTTNFRFGYGTYFPTGAMAEFDAEGSQRYDLIEGLLVPWHHQFTLAWKASPELTLAVATIASIGFFKTQLDVDLGKMMRSVLNTQDIPAEHSALAGRAKIPLTWTPAFGGAVGIHWRPTYKLTVGFGAFTPIHYNYDGKLKVKTPEIASLVGAALPALGIDETISSNIEAKAALPAFLQMGIRYQPMGYWVQEYFGRYILSSLERSLSIDVKSAPILEFQNVKIEGEELNDAWTIGTLQTFPLWQRWTPGLYTSFYKNGSKEQNFAVSRSDFDSLTIGGLIKYQYQSSLQIGLEYAHSFLFERTPRGTVQKSTSKLIETPSTDGDYRSAIDRAGVTVKYAF